MKHTGNSKNLVDEPCLQNALDVVENVIYGCIQLDGLCRCSSVFGYFSTVDRNGDVVLEAHLRKTNPLYKSIGMGLLRCRIVFSTVDGDPVRFNCDSNLRTDRPSPSWNFVVSQFFGTIEKVPDKELFPLLSRQIEQFEKKHGSDWRLRDATEYFKEQLLEAVFGIYFKCERVTTAFKRELTSPADQVTITAWNHILNSRYDALNQWMNH